MYLEHFHLNQSPFKEEPDPDVFFTGAGREAVYQSLLRDIEGEKPLIKLIGNEGSGKTLMCCLLMKHLPDGAKTVYLDNPVGSFDDLVRIVCLDLGMEPSTSTEAVVFVEELRKLVALYKEQQRKIVLIIDEAEKLFLATLERLVRIICDTEEADTICIILAGRQGLDTNLDQLSFYCANVDINAGYALEPMALEETGHYLNYRLKKAGLSDDAQAEIFTREAVEKIFDSSRGNFRLTNILAEESLQNSCSNKSFLVLLDHVKGRDDNAPKLRRTLPGFFDILLQNIQWVGVGGLILVALVVLLTLLPDGDEKEMEKVVRESESVTAPLLEERVEQSAGPEMEEAGVPVVETSLESTAPAVKKPALPLVIKEQEQTPQVTDKKPQAEQSGGRNGDDIFRERLGASAGWLAGTYTNRYTVQLMMLTSEQATPNLKKMLIKDEYYNIKNKLYLLRKKTAPPTLFVFYDSFESMNEARLARNRMPIFLRKHHPYALSISDALKKTED
ncbi:MAG: AAA family ATPase [Desulfobulbaceae bacterium]|nr:AAA family ATPase [Desulfobulbaceae bacterium]